VRAEEEMTIHERRKYLRRMQPRYLRADRAGKGQLLCEMEAVTGLHRESLVRLLRGDLERHRSMVVRPRTYGPKVEYAVRIAWESLDYICAERLHPRLLPTARHLSGFGELVLTFDMGTQPGQMSRATLGRMMSRLGKPGIQLPRDGAESANKHRRDVPMGRLSWETAEPGHFEMDLVHHSGGVHRGSTYTRCRWWT
jgi:hypothetical protein